MFATPPLMLEKYEGGDFNQLVEYVKQIPYDGETNGPQSNLPSTNHFILDDEIFVNLREFINGCI